MQIHEYIIYLVRGTYKQMASGALLWLEEKNPVMRRQINALYWKADELLAENQTQEALNTLKAWQNAMLFWNGQFLKGR